MKTFVAKLLVLFILLHWGTCGLLAQSGTKKAFIDKSTLFLTCSCGTDGIYSYQTKKDMTSYYACPKCESEWKVEYKNFEPIYMGKHICSTDKECLKLYVIRKNAEDKSIVYSISRFCKTTSPLNVTVIIGDKKTGYIMNRDKDRIEFKTTYTGTVYVEYGPKADAKANPVAKTPANKHSAPNKHSARNPIFKK